MHSDVNINNDGYYDMEIPNFADMTEFEEWKNDLNTRLRDVQDSMQPNTPETDESPANTPENPSNELQPSGNTSEA